MNLSIVYLTNRVNPRFHWFVSTLCREFGGSVDAQVIVIDSQLWYIPESERRESFKSIVSDRFQFQHVPPKPTVWQGKNRLTKVDYFAASNARNTGIALANNDHVVFVDDLSALMPGWLNQVRHCISGIYVVAGSYKKVKNLQVDTDGNVTFIPFEPGIDSRWPIGKDTGIVKMGGGGVYGCSFAAPTAALLAVNGSDEICDGQGAEDYDLGIRLERAGYEIFYNRNMLTLEDEDSHHEGVVMKKDSKFVEDYKLQSDFVLLNRVKNEPRVWTLGNDFNLKRLREEMLNGGEFPIRTEPSKDWRDGTPLTEM